MYAYTPSNRKKKQMQFFFKLCLNLLIFFVNFKAIFKHDLKRNIFLSPAVRLRKNKQFGPK